MASPSTSEVTVKVVEDTHAFTAEDGTALWFGGYVPVDEDEDRLSPEDFETSDPRCSYCRVAGTSHCADALQGGSASVGAQIILRPEPSNEHDRDAVAILGVSSEQQLGYVPTPLNKTLLGAALSPGQRIMRMGGLVIGEFRRGSESGVRVGLRVLIAPAGSIFLSVATDDDGDGEEAARIEEAAEATVAAAPKNVQIDCPACGGSNQVAATAGGFRCVNCQQDVWFLSCRRCKTIQPIHGPSAGAGNIVFRCQHCKAKTTVPKQTLRAINAEVRREERAESALRKEQAALHKALQASLLDKHKDDATRQDAELRANLKALEDTLASALATRGPFSFSSLHEKRARPTFSPGALEKPNEPPVASAFLPPSLTGLSAMVPGAKRKHEARVRRAEENFAETQAQYEQLEASRIAALAAAKTAFGQEILSVEEAEAAHNASVAEMERRFLDCEPAAVAEYYEAALGGVLLPYQATAPRIAYSPASRQLVIQLALPSLDVIPTARQYRYVKTRDEVVPTAMPETERRRRYADLVAQVALRTLHEAFRASVGDVVESVVVNGHVASIDKRTGKPSNPCLVTVRTTRERFSELDLARVDPAECLKGLSASLSRSPAELIPVRPVIDFDMSDPRFVTEQQVLETLDTRPNLMELTPSEFESLITNLFEQMGLDTKLTQASRDGGVDCVAYDARPILGGKVVIQAKRYKNTVGVSAVRDLFGTMQNEGATKGILVTTSGYGQASHDFANGKPLELIDGGNLLYLLQEHAGIEAKIEVPEDWIDPEPES
jgi:restriction system protein